MPEFSTPFPGHVSEHCLSEEALYDAVECRKYAQEEAQHIYVSIAERSTNSKSRRLFSDLADQAESDYHRLEKMLQERHSPQDIFSRFSVIMA